jgi:hypothetical protein
MEVKLVVIVVIAIISGAIGSGMSYSILNPVIVILQNEITTISDEVTTISDELDNLNSIGDLSTIHEALEGTQTDIASVNATVNEIADRTWNIVYSVSNTTSGYATTTFVLNSTIFPIQGKQMKVSWYFLDINKWGMDFTVRYVRIYHANGTFVDEVGMHSSGILFSAEKEFNVVEAGDYYVTIFVFIGSVPFPNAFWSINVWDYY